MTRICAFVLTVVGSAFAAVPTADSLPEFIHVDGERLRTQDGADFVIQGVGVGSLRAEPVEKDYEAIAGLKFNTVTLMLSYRSFYAETDPGDYIELGWKRLDEHVALARKYGLHVILQMSSVEGAQFVLEENAFSLDLNLTMHACDERIAKAGKDVQRLTAAKLHDIAVT